MSKFNAGQSFVDGDTVTGAKLNNITGLLDIYTGLISEQTAMVATVSTADQLLIADTDNGDSGAANRVTIQKLLNDTLTNGTYTNANLSGTITSNRTVATSATITTGTIPTLVSNNATIGTTTGTLGSFTSASITSGTITTGLIPTLTTGTTTGTAGVFTSGTIATLNSTTGTISNLSTTLAGDFTISQGTGTLGTSGVTATSYGTTSAIPVLTVDAKGRVTSGTSVTNPVGFRNRIINGDMRIDQRNAGASQTFTAAAALAYSVDRFYGYCTGANATGARVAGTAPNEFAYQFTGAASVTAIGFGTRLEATNTTDLAGSTATLSVQLANSLLSTVTWTAFYATTADAFGTLASPTRTQIATGTFTVTSSLATYSAQISVPSAATTGIEIVFTVGAQTSGTWTIDNVQLEAGSTATEFERRPIGTELALCQRYYLKLQPTLNNRYGIGRNLSTTLSSLTVPFPVYMRVRPTSLEQSGTAAHYGVAYLAVSQACTAVPTFAYSTELVSQVQLTNTAVLTAGQANEGFAANASGYLAWSAEL